MEKLDHILYKKEHPVEFSKVVNTGLADLDSSTAFLCKGELSLFGARPGMGKTAVAVQIAQSVAQQGLRVSWVSTWLSKRQIASRFAPYNLSLETQQLISIEDKIAVIHEVCSSARKLEELPDLLVVDDLQGLYRLSKRGNAVNDCESSCAALKELAWQADISILLLSGIKRTVDQRNTYLPRRDDFLYWERIKRWVDNACVFYRDGYYDSEDADKVNAYLCVGPSTDRCCSLWMWWDQKENRLLPVGEYPI